jgi:probable HAF family extracellular repeat protein
MLGLVCSTVSAAVKITDLGTLGGEYSFAYAINDLDQVVGRSWMVSGPSHSFLYDNGLMTDLSPLNSGSIGTLGPTGINDSGQIVSGAIAGEIYYPALYDHRTAALTILGSLGGVTNDGFNGAATAINNFGQVVGYSYVDDSWAHAFFYDKGIMQDMGCVPDAAGTCFSYALDINDRGQIVGGGSGGAFLYSHGVMTDITPFGSSQSYAYAINNRGQAAGYYYTNSDVHAFLYSHGTFTDIGAADSPETVAYDINDHGQAVGYTLVRSETSCRDCDFVVHAFLYENGVLIDLNTLLPSHSEWELLEAYAINNKGRIVGYGLIHGQRHAFLLELVLPIAQELRSRQSPDR